MTIPVAGRWDGYSIRQHLHKLSGAQLVCDEAQHASSDWEPLRVDQHASVPVEAHAASVGSLEFFLGFNYHSLLHGACRNLKCRIELSGFWVTFRSAANL